MRPEVPGGEPLSEAVPLPAVAEQPAETLLPRRTHLVTVTTRPLVEADRAEPGATMRARYWHPHERRWQETDYESVEALRERHIKETEWELLQEQQLDAPLAFELIFKAHRIDFTRPSREQILRDIGMTPDDVNHLLEHVDREQQSE
ncbi:MAG TPA: hypothetical protein VH680_11310 [Gemmatimonadales bacterium]|jgi:hypothetical protein